MDYFTRLIERTIGRAPVVQPLIVPHFAPGPVMAAEAARTLPGPFEVEAGAAAPPAYPGEPLVAPAQLPTAPFRGPDPISAGAERQSAPPAVSETDTAAARLPRRPGEPAGLPETWAAREQQHRREGGPVPHGAEPGPEEPVQPAHSWRKEPSPADLTEPGPRKGPSPADLTELGPETLLPRSARLDSQPAGGAPTRALPRAEASPGAAHPSPPPEPRATLAPQRVSPAAPPPQQAPQPGTAPDLPLQSSTGGAGHPQAAGRREAAEPLAASRSAEPSIRVTIGRVEVRAILPAAPPAQDPPTPRSPALSLDEYLKQRNEGQR